MDFKKSFLWFGVLCAFALFEFLMLSYLKGYFGIYFSPIIFFVASLGVSIAALFFATHLKSSKSTLPNVKIAYPIFGLGVAGLIIFAYSVFITHPIDNSQSDVFAQVLSPASWLLKGEYPYQAVVLPGYTMHNTYLPMQWLPFVISVIFGFDPRWIPLVAWSLAFLLFVKCAVVAYDKRISTLGILLMVGVALLSIFSIFSFIHQNRFDFCVTVELLPAAYYILLTIAFLYGSWWSMGTSLGLCLMSRFSIVLFIPFLMWYVWKRFGWTTLWKAGATAVVFVLIVFVLPFMTHDPDLPVKMLGNYDSGTLGEWSHHSWQEPGAEPYQISRGLGAAIFVKKLYEYDVKDGIHHLKQAEIVLSVVISLFMVYFYYRNRKFINQNWVFLGGLKLYFTIFYTLVLIPYPYLFVLPVTITSIILIKAYADIFTNQLVHQKH